MKPYDPTLKALVETAPESWPALFGRPTGPTEVIDADIATVTGAADKVLRVSTGPPYLLPLEFVAGHDAAVLPRKMHVRNALLEDRHDMLVRSGAVLLRPEADSPQLTGLYERATGRVRQFWTLPCVPGRRFGAAKPLYVLTSGATFSGGEQVSYDLQQTGRAVIVGARTKGGAHAREGFRVHPHLEATISVSRAVSPVTGGNWEGTGVVPDIEILAERARDQAYRLALEYVITLPGAAAAEARDALAERPGIAN